MCVYVDSHLRFQFNLTGLLGRGDGGGLHVLYVSSLLILYRDWFEVDE